MSDVKNPKSAQPGTKPDVADDELVQRDADELADKGREEEEKYDEDEGIFDK
jgi:hypothetical protein